MLLKTYNRLAHTPQISCWSGYRANKYNRLLGFFFYMVSNKIVVIRGHEISVIFYYSDLSGCTLHPYTLYTQHTTLLFFLVTEDLDKDKDTTCSWSSSGLGSGLGSESFSKGSEYCSVFQDTFFAWCFLNRSKDWLKIVTESCWGELSMRWGQPIVG